MAKILLLCAMLAACSRKGPATNEALDKLADLKVEMCACKDQACAVKVQATMSAWGKAQQKPESPTKVSEDDAKKMAQLGDEYGACLLAAIK